MTGPSGDARLSDVLRHWTGFRDARCDVGLIGFRAVGQRSRGRRFGGAVPRRL